MPGDKYTRNILIRISRELDASLDETVGALNQKMKFDAIYYLDELPGFADDHFKGARIYVHGHGDWYNGMVDGWTPEAVAWALAQANVRGAALISVTGCNSARGYVVGQKANQLWADIDEALARSPGVPAQSRLRGFTSNNREGRLHTDSRLVDTSKAAGELCPGSFAQRFHKALMDNGAEAPVHARLFVVSVDEDEGGKKRVMQTRPPEYVNGKWTTPLDRAQHHVPRSKIRITATADGEQDFSFVDYATPTGSADGATPSPPGSPAPAGPASRPGTPVASGAATTSS